MNNLQNIPAEQPVEVVIASAGSRMAACVINYIFTLIAFIPLFGVLVWQIASNAALLEKIKTDAHSIEANGIAVAQMFGSILTHPATLFGIFIIIAYTVWQIVIMSKHGQSLGKKLMKIKVIKSDGRKAGFVGTVLLREIVFNIASSILIGLLASILVSLSDTTLEAQLNIQNSLNMLPTIICLVMLFANKKNDRRTIQDYLADTVVVKLPG